MGTAEGSEVALGGVPAVALVLLSSGEVLPVELLVRFPSRSSRAGNDAGDPKRAHPRERKAKRTSDLFHVARGRFIRWSFDSAIFIFSFSPTAPHR